MHHANRSRSTSWADALGITIAIVLAGCGGTSAEELAKEVHAEIAKKVASDPELEGLQLGELTLVHRSGNEYRGILDVTDDGVQQQLSVSVTYDGSTLLWEIEE